MCFELRSWLRSLALGFFLSMAFGVMLCLAEGPAMAEGSGNLPLTIIEVDRLSEQYGKEARYTELIRLGRQALEQGMEFLALHQRMAMAYRALGRFEGAVSHDQRALEMHPGSSEIRSRLYIDLIACQRYQEAQWLYSNSGKGAATRPSLRWHTDLLNGHAAYTQPETYNNLIPTPLTENPSAADRQKFYYSLRDSSRPYAEATLQGPSILRGLVWGWSVGQEGHWVLRSLWGYNQFTTQSTGVVQSNYLHLPSLLGRDTVLVQPYTNTSRQYTHLMEFQTARMPAWRWTAGWSLFDERASYFSSQLDTIQGGLVGVDYPYRHRAVTGILGVAYRIRSAELRAGMVRANLNSDQQRQFDLGLTLWPLGNSTLLLGMEASYLNNRSNSGNVTEAGLVAMRCGMAPASLWRHLNGKRFQGQSPRLWMEASVTGGANLRNYTRPGTLWAMNSYENIRRIQGLSLRWKVPAKPTAALRGEWWWTATWQIQYRDQSYVALPWQIPPGSENPPTVSKTPENLILHNRCQMVGLSLLRTFL